MRTFLDKYMEFIEDHEAIYEFHRWGALFTASSMLGFRVWTNLGYGNMHPNLYIILVGPPATARKTEAIHVSKNMLLELRKEDYITLCGDDTTRERLLVDLSRSRDVRTLRDGTEHISHFIPAMSSEISNFAKRGDERMLDLLLSMFDTNESYEKTTKNSGDELLDNTGMSLFAATTPTYFKGHLHSERVGTGLSSRCIFIYSDVRRQNNPHPPINHKLRAEILGDLKKMFELCGYVPNTRKGKEAFESWYNKQPKSPQGTPEMVNYLGRKQSYIKKLCIILAAMDAINGKDFKINELHFETALQIMDGVEPFMMACYDSAGRNIQKQDSDEVLATIQATGSWVSKQSIVKKHFKNMGIDIINAILDVYVNEMNVVRKKRVGDMDYFMFGSDKLKGGIIYEE